MILDTDDFKIKIKLLTRMGLFHCCYWFDHFYAAIECLWLHYDDYESVDIDLADNLGRCTGEAVADSTEDLVGNYRLKVGGLPHNGGIDNYTTYFYIDCEANSDFGWAFLVSAASVFGGRGKKQ